MSIFCWKQLKCFHVGQCLGQEKHESHWSIFIDCFDTKMKRETKNKYSRQTPHKIHFRSNMISCLFFIIPFEQSFVKFPTVYSFFFLQHYKMSL